MALELLFELAQRGPEHGLGAALAAVRRFAFRLPGAVGVFHAPNQSGQAVTVRAVLGGLEGQQPLGVAMAGER
jgi:hypothetical protein